MTPVNNADAALRSAAQEIYESCLKMDLDAVLDDRDERPGVKFKDADLIGIPYRITVGKKLAQGQVEITERSTKKSEDVDKDYAAAFVASKISRMSGLEGHSRRVSSARELDVSEHRHVRPVAAPRHRSCRHAFRASR